MAIGTTNLDINSIVSQLMSVERRPLSKLDSQEASHQAKLSAYGSIKGAIASFQTALLGLNNAGAYQSSKATASDATIFSASATSTAVAGTYSLEVTSLTQAQKLVAAGQTSLAESIGTGAATTITFNFGTISGGTLTPFDPATNTGGTYSGATFTGNGNPSKSVTIDSSNNSLQGIRDAINAAGIGVTAAIVNDGSGTPYRLTLASNNMGSSNSLNISVSGDAAISNLLTNNPAAVAKVSGSSTAASGTKVAAAAAGTTAGTLAAGALVVTTSAGSANVGAVTLGTNAATNGAAIAGAISAALATLPGGAAANGSAAADGAGVITWTAGTNGSNTLSMGGFATDSTTATANRTALIAQTGFDAAQLGTQAIGAQKMAQSVAAQNAVFSVNGVQVTKTSNTVTDVVEGVTLNLSKVTTAPVALTVTRDTSAVSNSISSFVKAYNDIVTTLKNNAGYDATTKQGGILLGDSTVRNLQTQLRSMLNTSVVGVSGTLTRLADAGVNFQKDGTLAINQTKLNDAINNNFNDIASLFASVGKASDSLISFSSATSAAKPGSFAINVTQIATQGKAVGSAVTLPTAIVANTNDTLSLLVNGISASVTLTAGDYATAEALAAEVQSKINGVSALSSAGVSVAVSASVTGELTITSLKYGSTSSVSVTGGTAQASLGLSAPTQTVGVDAAGTIGGVTAVGDGQKLTVDSGAPAGLRITVNGGVLGDRGVLTYSQGYASTLSSWATSVLSSDGIISSRTKGIDSSIKDIGKRRIEMERRLQATEQRYRAQFTSLDMMLNGMNQTSNYLTQQLNKLGPTL